MALFLDLIDGLDGKHASGQTFNFSAFDVALKNFENFFFIVDGVPIDPRAPYARSDAIDGIAEAGGTNNDYAGTPEGGPINVLGNDADVDNPGG